MPDTLQLVILKKLTEHLEGLPGMVDETGAPTTMVDRVYRGRTVFGAEEVGPFIVILEGKRPDTLTADAGSDGLQRIEDWPLLFQGFMTDNPDTPLDNLYRLKGTVEARLAMIVAEDQTTGLPMYPDLYRLGGLLHKLRIGPGVVVAATPALGGTESFYLPVTVIFAMNVLDPFAGTTGV